jgi:hypothetical protein
VHQKLVISPEGLEVISRVRTAVSPVVVIGPYRSGKSFLLNQMLGLKCDEGFGVGHLRAAQTKGVWIWGEPLEVTGPDGKPLSIFFMDTEGFDSTGKTDVYDDRIFAFSALVSSVLVYNLPETVKEGDIEKLAFAVELADEFQGRAGRAQGAARGGGGRRRQVVRVPTAASAVADSEGLFTGAKRRGYARGRAAAGAERRG